VLPRRQIRAVCRAVGRSGPNPPPETGRLQAGISIGSIVSVNARPQRLATGTRPCKPRLALKPSCMLKLRPSCRPPRISPRGCSCKPPRRGGLGAANSCSVPVAQGCSLSKNRRFRRHLWGDVELLSTAPILHLSLERAHSSPKIKSSGQSVSKPTNEERVAGRRNSHAQWLSSHFAAGEKPLRLPTYFVILFLLQYCLCFTVITLETFVLSISASKTNFAVCLRYLKP
jgi:hypothetical protein